MTPSYIPRREFVPNVVAYNVPMQRMVAIPTTRQVAYNVARMEPYQDDRTGRRAADRLRRSHRDRPRAVHDDEDRCRQHDAVRLVRRGGRDDDAFGGNFLPDSNRPRSGIACGQTAAGTASAAPRPAWRQSCQAAVLLAAWSMTMVSRRSSVRRRQNGRDNLPSRNSQPQPRQGNPAVASDRPTELSRAAMARWVPPLPRRIRIVRRAALGPVQGPILSVAAN